MNIQVQPRLIVAERRLPFECVALVLQGGGALGAYQAGVYQALSEADIHPDWIAGVSIGAINAAIIAGNPLNSRVDRLADQARERRDFHGRHFAQITETLSTALPQRRHHPIHGQS
jgi:predicted acylesterase/phospholipase RssA